MPRPPALASLLFVPGQKGLKHLPLFVGEIHGASVIVYNGSTGSSFIDL
jgi:hypothetical protein